MALIVMSNFMRCSLIFASKSFHRVCVVRCQYLVLSYLFVNTDNYLDWVLREKALESTDMILHTIESHLARLSGLSIVSDVRDRIFFILSSPP